MTLNYTVRYIGNDTIKNVTYGNISFQFNKENDYVVNLEPLLTPYYNINSHDFKFHARQILNMLIKDADCLPSLSIESAIKEAVELFNQQRFIIYRDVLNKEIDALRTNMIAREVEMKALFDVEKQKLSEQSALDIQNAQEQAKDVSNQIEQLTQTLNNTKAEDAPTRTKIATDIAKSNTDIQNFRTQITRFTSELSIKQAELEVEQRDRLNKELEGYRARMALLQSSRDGKLLTFYEGLSEKNQSKIDSMLAIIYEDEKGAKRVKKATVS